MGVLGEVMSLTYVFAEELCIEGADTCVVWAVNPIGIPGVPNPEYGSLSAITLGLLSSFAVISAVSFVVRFVRSRGVERLQLKWFTFAVVSVVLVVVAEEIVGDSAVLAGVVINFLFGLSLLALPTAVGIAVLRYRLYEIDRIVSRTVSYVLVVGLLAVVYVGGFLLLTEVLPFQGDLGVAASTLAVFVLFNPVRGRIQSGVDHRFNRFRFDAEKVIEGFASSLRDRIDPADVVGEWVGVVSATMHPTMVGVWVRSGTGRVSS
jgi:hypothetical protein